MSLPSRERGLKPLRLCHPHNPSRVAPFTGAWIETSMPGQAGRLIPSLPSRERGLKLLDRNPTNRRRAGRSLHGSVD